MANAAADAARLLLRHGKGSLNADKAGGSWTGLGGGRLPSASPEKQRPPVQEIKHPKQATALEDDKDEDSSENDAVTVAPLAHAMGAAPALKQEEKKALTEDDLLVEAQEALECFRAKTGDDDQIITEAEMKSLSKEVAKKAQDCRKRSLVHTASKLSDINKLLCGAALLLQKARAYRKKCSESTGRALIAGRDQAQLKYDLTSEQIPSYISSDILWLEAEKTLVDGDIFHAISLISDVHCRDVLGSADASAAFQAKYVTKLLAGFIKASERLSHTDLLVKLLAAVNHILTGELLSPGCRVQYVHLQVLLKYKDVGTMLSSLNLAYKFCKEACARTTFPHNC